MCGAGLVVAMASASASAVVFVPNHGFNIDDAWTVDNDAELGFAGGEAGWTWTTPVNNNLVIESSEDVFPTEGDGFLITYAGNDFASQTVTIPEAGEYTLSIDYNGIQGVGATSASALTLTTGRFVLFAGGEQSAFVMAPSAGGWETFEWTVMLPAGPIEIGVQNTLSTPYAIAYDNLRIVPTPGAMAVIAAGGLIATRRRVR